MLATLRSIGRLVLLIPALLAGAESVAAADLNARLMFSGGGSFLLDRDVRDVAGKSYPANFKDKLQAGILAGIDLHTPLALEAGFRIGSGDFHVKDGSLLPSGNPIGFTVQQFFCNAVYNTPYSDGGLRLFATGGIGLRRIYAASAFGSDVDWSFNFGGGLEGRPSRRFSIKVELRDFVGAMPRFSPAQANGGSLHDIQPSIGLVVHLR